MMMCCSNAARTAVGCLVLSFVVLGLVSPTKQTDKKHDVKKQGNMALVFDPLSLDFGDCAVSVVWRQKVNVKNNKFTDKPINILSISGSSLHFHCSFVENKVLEPQANTSFEVAFLSREEGYAEDMFYIHTNWGSFPYKVQARGTANPFLARPLVNFRIPVNTSFSPLIHLYNPFASALQVVEMYGSSCDLHLEMPGGSDSSESLIDWWLIPPHQSRAIARVNFLAARDVNLTAFVRIRTNYTAHPHGSLMLPVDVEVTSQPLLFCPQQFLDFGVVHPGDPPKSLKVFVTNAGNRPVTVQNVTANPPNDGLTVEFNQVKVPPSISTAALAALVTFTPSKVKPLRTTTGRLTIATKNSQYKATIGYQITVPTSYLTYNKSSVNFLASTLPACQSFTVSNEFPLAVQITHVSLKHQDFIEMDNVEYPVVNPRERAAICRLCLKQLPIIKEKPFSVDLEVKTNASAPLRAPISVFNGKLTVQWSEDANDPTRITIGRLIKGSLKDIYLALFNNNPIGVALEGWNATGAVLTYLGSEGGPLDQFRVREGFANLTLATTLRPGSYAVFHVRVEPNEVNRAVVGVKTGYETLELVVEWQVVEGALRTVPETLEWSTFFLDPMLSVEVRLNSTLNSTITILGFEAPGGHKSKLIVDSKNSTKTIEPMQSSSVGRLLYPIEWHCAYPTLRQLLNGWQQDFWNAYHDLSLTSSLYECFESIAESFNSSTVRMTTKEIGSIELGLNLNIQWPRLSAKRKINFPLTETGRQSRIDLILTNPTSSVILSQILWLEDAGVQVKDLVARLPNQLVDAIDGGNSKKEPFAFEDTDEETGDSMMVYLTPGSKAIVGITFNPMTETRYKSVLMIKNNVTGIELITFTGRGQSTKLFVGNKPPGSSLTFEIDEQHLKNCHVHSKYHGPSVTVKKTFTVRNKGSFAITVASVDISGSPCEGYGFRVLNCQLIQLLPGENSTLEIAFTPDFTQTKIERHLAMKLVGRRERIKYKLVATVPGAMIPVCAPSMPRPDWEGCAYYALVIMCVVVAVGSVTSALIDAHHVLTKCVWNVMSFCRNQEEDEVTARGHLLDLRAIAREAVYSQPPRSLTPPPVPSSATSTSALAPPLLESKKSRKAKQKALKTTKLAPIQWKRLPTPPDTPPRSASPPAPPTPPPVRTVMEETRIFAKAVKCGKNKTSKATKLPIEQQKANNKQTAVGEASDRKRARSPKAVKKEDASLLVAVLEASPAKKSNEDVPVDGWHVKSDGSAVPVGKILPEVRRVEERTLPKPIGFGSQGKPWIAEPKKDEWSSAAWWPDQSLFAGSRDEFGLRRFDVASSSTLTTWQEQPVPRAFSPWSGPQLLDLVSHRRDDTREKEGSWDDPRWPTN